MTVDFKTLTKVQQVALIAGALSILLSFFGSYISISYRGGGLVRGVSTGTNAWTSYATLGVLLVIGATVIVALNAFSAATLPAGVPWNLVALAASGLGTVLLILRAVTAGSGGLGVSVGPGWSGFALFLTGITLTVCTALMFKESGEEMPSVAQGTPTKPSEPQ